MNREELLKPAKNEEERLLLARIADLAFACDRTRTKRYSPFLNQYDVSVAQRAAQKSGCSFCVWGGYEEAERKILCFYPEFDPPEQEEFPISVIQITGYDCNGLSHRDYLGSLLGLGVKRECVGDILILEAAAYLLCAHSIEAFVLSQLERIGSRSIKTALFTGQLPSAPKEFREILKTVSSLRYDCIVSAACNLSRGESAELIKKGLVQADWEEVTNGSAQAQEGVTLSVKGYGRMKLDKINGSTKKGRISVTFQKYV